MEKINSRFLNYKHYDSFLRDLHDRKISNDSIVFIQEGLRIWARGTEYVCDSESTYNRLESLNNKISGVLRALSDLETDLDGKQDITPLDSKLDAESINAVENRAIVSALDNYVLYSLLLRLLANKQDTLKIGEGLSLQEGVLSATLDTNTFLVVDVLPEEGLENKIYMVPDSSGEETKYYSYKWDGTDWVPVGDSTPRIDLSEYLKTSQADAKYITFLDLLDLQTQIEDTYQKKANYALVGYVNARLEDLQRIVDQKYVLKKDVYRPEQNSWSSTTIVPMGDTSTIDPGNGGSGTATNLITLTETAYQALVELGAVQNNVYYFTYEGEEETTNWTFGGTFPVILAGEGLGTFPITLN